MKVKEEVFSPFYMDDEFLKRERQKAKELKKTKWWQRKLSQGRCYYCGRKFPPSVLTMDHIVPISRGGRSVKSNLVPACQNCNFSKKHQLGFEFELKKINE